MRSSILIAATALATSISAANTTIPLFLMADDQPLVASVISAAPSTTSLAVSCPPDEDASDCGFGPGVTVEVISSTIFKASMLISDTAESATLSWSCDVSSAATQAVCVMSAEGDGVNDPGVSTGTISGTDFIYNTATVTAGQEKLAAATSGASVSSSASESSAAKSSGLTTKAGASTAAQATGTGATATGSSASPANTGAAYKFGIEGSALFALAGAAALNVL